VLEDRGLIPGRCNDGIFLFATASTQAVKPTQPPIQWIKWAVSPGVKRPGCEADHLPPANAEVENAWRCTSSPNKP
jgi:hypothetical protein